MGYKHEYYEKNSKKYNRQLVKYMQLVRREIDPLIGARTFDEFKNDVLKQFNQLLKEVQYVGGDKNRMTSGLVQSAYFFAIYDALTNYGVPIHDIGHLLTNMGEKILDRIPDIITKIAGKYMYNSATIKRRQNKDNSPKNVVYKDDWVSTIEEVNSADCDIKIIYTQCAIQLFAKNTGHLSILPYMCNLDYKLYKKLGLGLKRTKTLAEGYECCDFMISRKGQCLPLWPPQFLDKSTNYR